MRVADPDVVIASSSSGLMPTQLQKGCARHPERVVVGHPFNPPHLIPLVEVVGGEATSDAAIERAMAIYTAIGKSPVRIRVELPGHVTNRLQAALWREAYWLVEQGVVSVADVDPAISSGPGLRWALLGPFATQHLSGGEGGIAHVLEHLGPPMVEWWADDAVRRVDAGAAGRRGRGRRRRTRRHRPASDGRRTRPAARTARRRQGPDASSAARHARPNQRNHDAGGTDR